MNFPESWDLDPAEVRLRNFVPKEDFPFKTAGGLEYDTGDYSMNLKRALELSHYEKWRREQEKRTISGQVDWNRVDDLC